jgi:hypothetical protein
MCFSDDPSPPARTTLSPVVRLRAECYRAEQILTGAIEDDGAGIHDDPLTPDTVHTTTASADYYHPRPPHRCLTARPCRMSVCGARHLQHNAHQSEPTLLHPERLLAAQPPCTPTRSHPSPLRVHCRLLRSAVRGSCAHNLFVHLPSRHTSQPQVTGESTVSRAMARKHSPSTRILTRTSQSLERSTLVSATRRTNCRGGLR